MMAHEVTQSFFAMLSVCVRNIRCGLGRICCFSLHLAYALMQAGGEVMMTWTTLLKGLFCQDWVVYTPPSSWFSLVLESKHVFHRPFKDAVCLRARVRSVDNMFHYITLILGSCPGGAQWWVGRFPCWRDFQSWLRVHTALS